MASRTPVRSLQTFARRSRQCYVCASSQFPARQFSTTVSRAEEHQESQSTDRPRWSYTPELMKAPFSPRIKDPNKAWESNNDPQKLDAMYSKMLGRGGENFLTEEVKWLAVTHKSFDQGRRGFNDRLAFFGKRIILLQTSLALLHFPQAGALPTADAYGREPFKHPALDGLANLDTVDLEEALGKDRLARLAKSYGIADVTRWKPKNPANMAGSGADVVHTTSLFAIIGAISLQKGGEAANRVVRDKVLRPLGLL